ncbi:putative metalloprotease CJM1_0395 family protein [Alteromonas oceanisediminis]|uniref:putative metalloprotease CJM1_0395 family protein n=1 Tax=Alteromonas oceanisediminis TaxID=2836180 RepID=UPI001BDA9334|nr:putative metalloprotease CJM1_0395 family protein [Alteromonas oceanisediminis]MBT0587874.1 hypothetical protein [Alteromonas oceanisediminis]
MNIVTPIPTGIVFTNANVNTESVRRDNLLRETIPQAASNDNSEAKSGLGSESDRAKAPGQVNGPLVYERPQNNPNGVFQGLGSEGSQTDNAQDESAGREGAEARQQQQQELAEQREIQELKQRDQEVRAHEQAHAAVGGQYAGAPSYEFETGPDGRRYAVGGEVSIDIGEERSPEQTLRKMQQVKAAALAPADPSPQDLRVASEATQKAFDAQSEINQERSEALAESRQNRRSGEAPDPIASQVPELEDIVDGIDISVPQRSLDESARLATEEDAPQQSESILRRVDVIQSRYQNAFSEQVPGLSLSA